MTAPTSALWTKADAALRGALKRVPEETGEMLVIVVVLDLPASAAKFAEESSDFVRALEALGGQAVERLWIASSIVAQVPRAALETLAVRSDVRQLILNSERNILLK